MKPENKLNIGLARMHVLEAYFHLELARDALTNLEEDSDLDSYLYDLFLDHHIFCISSSMKELDHLHANMIEDTPESYDYNDWTGIEAFLERARSVIQDWSAYQFSSWKSTGKDPTNGKTKTTCD